MQFPSLLKAIGFLVAISVIHSSPAETTTAIVLDKFADGDRKTQTPPLGEPPYSSIPWYTSVSKWVKADSAGMTFTTQGGSAMVWGFFAPPGDPVSLKVGESLRFSFDYTYSTDISEYVDFRFGLFNFGDGERPTDKKFSSRDLKGYFVITRSQGYKETGASLYAENNAGTEAETFNSKSPKVGSPFPSVDAKADTHRASITVKRTSEESVEITTVFDAGGTGSAQVDSETKLTTFDSVALYLGRTPEGATVTLTNLSVELIAP